MSPRAAAVVLTLAALHPAAAAERDAPRPGAAERVEHRAPDDAPTLGPRSAPVTFELFFTPGSPPAHEAYRTLVELQRRHPTRLRAVFRLLHRNQNTPDIALAAHRRGRFFELMALLSAGGVAPSAAQAIELAVKVGVPRSAAERAHLDDAIRATLEENRHRISRLGSTQQNLELVVNGQPVSRRGMHAGSAAVVDLEREYLAAYEDARRAETQGMTPDALVRWSSVREACGDGDEEDEEEEEAEGEAAAAAEAAGAADPAAAPNPPPPPPRYANRLGRLLFRGTGCRVARHMPATLDDGIGAAPDADPVPLLAAPIPTAGLPSFGPDDAPVPILVVCNLRGRFCLEQLDRARRVAEHHPGEVRVLWVPWVDTMVDGADRDLTLAQAALCAARDGDGWTFLTAINAVGVPVRGRIDLAAISAYAGLDVDRVLTCAGGEPSDARAVVKAARDAGIGWGPTIVIGGRAYIGGFGDDRPASQRVAAELAPGLLEALVPSEP